MWLRVVCLVLVFHRGFLWCRAAGSEAHSGAPTASLRGATDVGERGGHERRPRLVETTLVELQEETPPWSARRVVKLFVPVVPEVAKMWSQARPENLTARLVADPGSGEQSWVRLHVWVPGLVEASGARFDGVDAPVDLSNRTDLDDCRFEWVKVTVDLEPLASLGTLQALRLDCPAPAREQKQRSSELHLQLQLLLLLKGILWLCPPWPLFILLPRMAQSFCFVSRELMLWFERKTRARGRVRHMRSLARRSTKVDGAFGQGEPCCICLGELSRGERGLIVLLPCKHTLHRVCYRSWLLTDTYPSRDLVCPLCRCRAEAVGEPSGS